MGGKKQTPKVYDYLLSVDYGLAHGRLDRLNQVWVKDKVILCGGYTNRVDIEINLPELFGGDDAEGGCVGTVEYYPGDFDAKMSDQLAHRLGLTPDTAPGYRGTAHLFFRGGRAIIGATQAPEPPAAPEPDEEEEDVEVIDIRHGPGGPGSIAPFIPVDPDGNTGALLANFRMGEGFQWTTNNPYFPGMKAAVSRFPRGTNIGYHEIWPMDYEGGTALPSVSATFGGVPWFRLDDGEPALDSITSDLWESAGITAEEASEFGTDLTFEVNVTYDRTPYGNKGTERRLVAQFYGDGPRPGSPGAVLLAEAVDVSTGSSVTYLEVTQKLSGEVPQGTRYAVFFLGAYGDNVDLKSSGSARIIGSNEEVMAPGPKVNRYYAGYVEEPYLNDYRAYAAVIDAGQFRVSFGWRLFSTLGGEPHGVSLQVYLRCYPEKLDEDGEGLGVPDRDSPISIIGATEDPWDGGINTISGAGTLPAGTRFVDGIAIAAPYIPLFAKTIWDDYYSSSNYSPIADVHCNPDGTLGPLPDANPAHMIYEAMTNTIWGAGEPAANFDLVSFNACVQTLYDESFGLSIRWDQETIVKDYVQDIIDHIKAVMFPDPETGKWVLRLLRDNYDRDSLETLSPRNCVASDRRRRSWGEIVNRITVQWTDPQTEDEATVSAFENGSIAIQGKAISDTRNYYGIRNPMLAQRVAEREVREAAYPLFSCKIEGDRRFWKTRPGDVYRLSWPEDGIADMIVRVMRVNYGSAGDRRMTFDVVEDVFALESTKYEEVQGSEWKDAPVVPGPLDAQTYFEAPYALLARAGVGEEALNDPDAEGTMGLGYAASPKPTSITVYGSEADGGTDRTRGTLDPARAVQINAPIKAEAESLIPVSAAALLLGGDPEEGDVLLFGQHEPGSEDGSVTHEFVALKTYKPKSKAWVISRGVWDTVPLSWPAGTWLWEVPTDAGNVLFANDPEAPYEGTLPGETWRLAQLMTTPAGTLSPARGEYVLHTVQERKDRPFRPANTELEGRGFDLLSMPTAEERPDFVTATWSNRNRTTEDAVVKGWEDGNVQPEAGQTTRLVVRDNDGDVVAEYPNLPGSSFGIPLAVFTQAQRGWVEFWAERDGLLSLTAAKRRFDLREIGYGFDYGDDYGGEVTGYGTNYGEEYGQ